MNAPLDAAVDTDADSVALDAIDVSDPRLYQDDVWYPYFARLRREDPVHCCRDSRYGPYWSVTKYKDIMQVEVNHAIYSSASELGGIQIEDQPKDMDRPSFIRMDPPRHDEQRKVVSPVVAPANLANMEGLIRERTARVLDGLPRNETFDWVDRVSVELTTMMLATLFDYPWDDRRQLTYWSDVAIANVRSPESPVHSEEEKFAELTKMAEALGKLFDERAQQPPKFDLLSMLAHGEATRNMPIREFMGTLSLLIVGGNDTTRNSMTGGLMALNEHSGEYQKLRDDPSLIPGMVSEIIRYVTPVIHMRRTAKEDAETRRQADQEGRQGGDVVRLRQPRSRGDRRPGQLHHRPAAAATTPLLRLRHPSLRRQSARRTAVAHPVGRNHEALPGDRGHGPGAPGLLQLHPRHPLVAGAHSGVTREGRTVAIEGGTACRFNASRR